MKPPHPDDALRARAVDAERAELLDRLTGAADAAERAALLGALAAADAAKIAALVDAPLAAALVAPLGSESRSEQRHAADAIAPLVTRAPALAAALETALVAPQARLRWGSAFTLGRAHAAPPPHLWPAVRETMALEDGDQRWAAAELARRLVTAHPELLDDLRAALRDGSDVLRKMALYCLREARPADLGALARSALADAAPGVRLAAIAALTDAGGAGDRDAHARAIADLVDADPAPGVRRAAAAALGKLGARSPEVLAALERAAAAADASLARAARGARERLDDGRPGPAGERR